MHALRHIRRIFAGAFALVILLAASLSAATVTYKNGSANALTGAYSGTDDVMMLTNGGGFFFSSTDNFGLRGDMAVGNTGGSAEHIRRTLVRFDVSSLTGQYSSITSATLRLYVTGPPAGAGTVNLFRLADANAGWVEGNDHSANGYNPNDAGGSTWAYKIQGAYPNEFTGTLWAGGGTTGSVNGAAGVAGTDYFATSIASIAYTSATSGFVDFVFNDPSLIHTWITGTNAGLLLRQANEGVVAGGNLINFHSSESVTAGSRPELIIDYNAVPEPTRAFLGMMGVAALIYRRRRH